MSDNLRAATLRWTGQGLAFEGMTGSGGPDRVVPIDGDSASGASPMELLLLSLGGCMAIDVRMILERSRVGLVSLELDMSGERRDEAPRYYTSIQMHFRITGPAEQDRPKVARAVQLSEEKYCSVYHTLRPDLDIRSSFELD